MNPPGAAAVGDRHKRGRSPLSPATVWLAVLLFILNQPLLTRLRTVVVGRMLLGPVPPVLLKVTMALS